MMFDRQHCLQQTRGMFGGGVYLSALLGWTACVDLPLHDGAAELEESAQASVLSQGLDTPTDHPRYVDYTKEWQNSGCPHYPLYDSTPVGQVLIGTWVGEPLFQRNGRDSDDSPDHSSYVPARLRGYCIFSWRPSPGHPEAFRAFELVRTGATKHVHLEDTQVVSGLEPMALFDRESAVRTEDLSAELSAAASEYWDIDRLAYDLVGAREARQVSVAVIDNSPYGSEGQIAPKDAPHGRAVTNVVRALACPEGEASTTTPCVIQHSAHLALPQATENKADWLRGGYVGTRSQVAVAIWDAVLEAEQDVQARKKLILNLSIGWAADPEDLYPPDLAVRDAIAYARCKGHLAIAAAGNRARVFDEEPGPLFPGAFESEPSPSAATCAAWFGAASPAKGKEARTYDPLVFALGAVDPHDAPIRATRKAGRPPLAAYGFLVLTRDTMKNADAYDMLPLTGSSIAAAAASGVAALVWSVAPDLTPAEVMGVIYDSGVNLADDKGRGASDFRLATASKTERVDVHRISMCRAVLAAAGVSTDACQATIAAYAGGMSAVRSLPLSSTVAMGNVRSLSRSELSAFRAGPGINTVHEPWAGPQPTSSGCSTCWLWGGGWFYAINPVPTIQLNVSLTPAMHAQAGSYELLLTTESADGEASFVVTPPATNPQSFSVSVPVTTTVDSATLTFQQESNGVVVETYEQILVQ